MEPLTRCKGPTINNSLPWCRPGRLPCLGIQHEYVYTGAKRLVVVVWELVGGVTWGWYRQIYSLHSVYEKVTQLALFKELKWFGGRCRLHQFSTLISPHWPVVKQTRISVLSQPLTLFLLLLYIQYILLGRSLLHLSVVFTACQIQLLWEVLYGPSPALLKYFCSDLLMIFGIVNALR